jgi:hypothetical protein
MCAQRKKVEKKPVLKVEPKKRDTPIEVPKIEVKENVEPKPKRSENKYVRISIEATNEERKAFNEKFKSGDIKFAYCGIENDKLYHYFLILKK